MEDNERRWNDALTRDVDRRAAIIVPLPGNFDPWASGFDFETEFANVLRHHVVQAISTEIEPEIAEETRATFYHVGPMAQSPPMYLITMLPDAISLMADIAGLIGLAQLARSAVHGVRSWFDSAHERIPMNPDISLHRGPSILLSEPLVVGLCYEHFNSNYMRNDQRIKIDRSFRSSSPEYSSAEHPGGDGYYTVRIWTGKASYLYMVDCFGETVDHLLIQGRDMKQLILPNWFAAPVHPLHAEVAVRSSDVKH